MVNYRLQSGLAVMNSALLSLGNAYSVIELVVVIFLIVLDRLFAYQSLLSGFAAIVAG